MGWWVVIAFAFFASLRGTLLVWVARKGANGVGLERVEYRRRDEPYSVLCDFERNPIGFGGTPRREGRKGVRPKGIGYPYIATRIPISTLIWVRPVESDSRVKGLSGELGMDNFAKALGYKPSYMPSDGFWT
jgi:hypothetical protein